MSEKLTSNGLGSEVVRSAADHTPKSLLSAQTKAIALAKEKASKSILDKWAIEKQINAALGLLSQPETAEIKSGIQQSLAVYNATKIAIMKIVAVNEDDISEEEKNEIANAG